MNKAWNSATWGVYFLITFSLSANALVQIETSPYQRNALTTSETTHSAIAKSITDRSWDKHHFKFLLKNDTASTEFELSAKTFADLSTDDKARVVDHLASYYNDNSINMYVATVNADDNKLEQEPIIEGLGVDAKKIKGIVPAEQLLSKYAQKWAYKESEKAGANCWHTSMASIFPNWSFPRRMLPPEFLCHIKTSFLPIKEPSQWGDLVRLAYPNDGGEVHGFTFLGVDKKDPKKKIVFTKNGYNVSEFLFMDIDSVRRIYAGTEVTYYRPVKTAIDPKEDTSSICAKDSDVVNSIAVEADPMLVYAIKRRSELNTPEIAL